MRGWVLAEQGQVGEGLAQIHEGLAAIRGEAGQRQSLALLVEVYEKGGQAEKGLSVLDEALAMVERNGESYYEAELYRLKGELTLQSKVESEKWKEKSQKARIPSTQHLTSSTQAEAEACFLKAIDIALKQQAKSWELRATTSLARLWQQQGKKDAARQMLGEVYGWFTEGFDTVDLKEAKALLKELSD